MKLRSPKSFDVLGNIAIVNFPLDFKLKDKKKFANKLLKEHKIIKTILEKKGKIRGRLRKLTTRHLAGEKTKEVLYKENNCVFRFNIDTTYFSPRLSNERKEIASLVKKNENVLVMFAGVAPFSIVIAKNSKVKRVISNEINREANKYAKLNIELNNVKDKVELVSGDVKRVVEKWKKMRSQVREMNGSKLPSSSFSLKKSVKSITKSQQSALAKSGAKSLIQAQRDNLPKFDMIVMPRPKLKDTFLEQAFMLSKKGTRIYYYDFCGVEEENLIIEKIKEEAKKYKKKVKILKIKKAGEIAPYKIRVRVDFKII